MPIYEFKCLVCGEISEILVMGADDSIEMKCKHCKGEELERVMSTTRYSMADSGGAVRAGSQTRTCSSGSCTTYDIPGCSR